MKLTRWLSAIFIIVVVVASLGFVKFTQIQAMIAFGESFPEPSATVIGAQAEVKAHSASTRITGQLQATQHLVISNEYSGAITKVNFVPGQLVEKNQLLLQIDSSSERANLAAAEARYKLAKSSYNRLSKLLEAARVSQEQVDQAEANVSVAKAEIANLQTVIDKKTIKAPFTGRLGLENFQVGQFLSANSQLTELVGVEPHIWVDFKLPQTLPQLKVGETIQVSVIRDSQQPETFASGKVIAKHASIDQNSRQVSYRALLNNESQLLQHNQIVAVIIAEPAEQVVIVPAASITRNETGEYIFVLTTDEKNNYRASSVKVTLGERLEDQQVITNGLTGGELIAADGAFKLKEKMLVYVESQNDQAQSSSQGAL